MDVLAWLVSTRIAADLAVLVLVKGSAVVLALGVCAWLLRGRSASVRHRLWVVAFAALFLLPFIGSMLPRWRAVTVPYPAETMLIGLSALETEQVVRGATGPADDVVVAPPAELPLASVLLVVWWVGVLAVSVGIVFALVRAHLLRRRCRRLPDGHALARLMDEERRRLGIRRPVRLLLAPDTGLAATLGTIRPAILIGSDVARRPLHELRALFIHELAHVKRHDYLTFLLGTFALPVYWPNPLVWWARRQAAHEREQACDDQVLDSGIASPLYARVLLDFSVQAAVAPAMAGTTTFIRLSPTVARIRAILNHTLDRRPLGVVAGTMVAAAVLALLVPTASLSVMASVPGTGTVDDLVAALHHADPAVRERAARTLGRRDAAAVRLELEALLDDADSGVRLAAMAGLEQLADPASLPAMAHVLERPFDGGRGEHGFVLKYAIIALGKMGSPEARLVLEAQLDRPVAPLRWMALETIMSMPGGTKAAYPHLVRFARSDPSERNRRLAAAALNTH